MDNPPVARVYYFCDESSYMTGAFMAVAGLAVPDRELPVMTAELVALKKKIGGPSEVKWSNVGNRRDSIHKAFVDYFFDAIEQKRIQFQIRFAPFTEYDHTASGPKKRVDTTSKMHYQLLLHRALAFYGPYYKLRIRPDGGDCTAALVNQIASLHRWGAQHHQAKPDCIESIEPRDSTKEVMLQLLDVPLGALTALRNERVLTGPKQELAQYVRAKVPNLNLAANSPKGVKRFAIWNVTPSGVRRGPWG
jgi:hypothetical protein